MKANLCLIGGSGFLASDLFKSFKPIKIKNQYGRAVIFRRGNIFFVQRHLGDLPPQRINFKAYFQALAGLKVKQVICFNSAGALKKNWRVPALLVPHDFICLNSSPTFFDKTIKHTTPRFSSELRKYLIKICRQTNRRLYERGVYWQTSGPRFETVAEVKMFSHFADVVGMTLANEVILANELGMAIASVCSVDNYSNGVSGHLDYKIGATKNTKILERLVEKILCKF